MLTPAVASLQQVVVSVFSVPNLAMLLRLSPLVTLIDEFSYYTYHDAQYDRGFRFIAELCWQINNAKWVPPSLVESLDRFAASLQALQIPDWASVTPSRFSQKH